MIILFSTNKKQLSFKLLAGLLLFFCVSCEPEIIVEEVEETIQLPIADLIQQKSYWEGSSAEFENSFQIDEEGNIKSKENDSSFSGYIKIRARNGTIISMKSYTSNLPDGDFFDWYENGKLKFKAQYKMGEKHGYFYIWTKKGDVYSQKYFQNGMEDFGRFENEGASETGKSLASLELAEWEGNGLEFYTKFAGDPKRGGLLHIRETEELYTGIITALDDNGNKEAVLRYSNGKYEGRISKWDADGKLWHEAEYSRGDLVQITLKDGKPFDPNQIIDLSDDDTKVGLLFED
jgi:antitoxin component YwqK of YwqJK toxin-antitoxin module